MVLKTQQAKDILVCASDYATHDPMYTKDKQLASGQLISIEDLGHSIGIRRLEETVLVIRNHHEKIKKFIASDENSSERSDFLMELTKILKRTGAFSYIPTGTDSDSRYKAFQPKCVEEVEWYNPRRPAYFEQTTQRIWYDLFKKMRQNHPDDFSVEMITHELINLLVDDKVVQEVRLGHVAGDNYVPFVKFDRELVERRANTPERSWLRH